jgi:ParB/RepB/Spo0J family partition protein
MATQPSARSVVSIPVASIRPEDGLSRKRDRDGHQELRDSIARFGVLTPITVRRAPDDPEEYLLIKGQGRTLACRMLGRSHIDAVVLDEESADNERVQQFLVENVARLRMRPVDRALLIAHARASGEETASVAARFGISAATVRRLETQLDGASTAEIAALRSGGLSLAVHGVIARNIAASDRDAVVATVQHHGVGAGDLQALLLALGWARLEDLGAEHRDGRLALLEWACDTFRSLPRSSQGSRLRQLAARLPLALPALQQQAAIR